MRSRLYVPIWVWFGKDVAEPPLSLQKLPPPTPRREKSSASPVDHPLPHTLPYEPPSPSRPWQLIDVLWHPLPPPQRSSQPGSPVSPSSPRKRSREDDTFPLPPYYPSPSRLHNDSPHTRNTLSSHARRASASSGALHSPRTPNSHSRRSLSQSHAHRHSLPPTTQDVDAAKALTSMLESASPKSTAPPPTPAYPPLNDQSPARQKSLLSPVTTERSNSRSRTPQKDHSDIRRVTPPDRDEADTDAAELMMFLAHSPSPARTVHHSPSRSVGGAARVLFSESDTPNKVERHSNLALAPPITASDHRRLTGA